jgi:hypothetical protein
MKNLKNALFYAILFALVSSCGVKQKEFLYDYIPVRQKKDDKKISLIDYDGKIIVEDEFDYTSSIYPTDDVITEMKSDGKVRYWQIDDKKVKPLIDNEYYGGTPFFEGVAVVRDDKGLLSLIDKKGKALIANLSTIGEYQVVRTGVMSDGLIRFKTTEGLWGYINKSGEVVIKPAYVRCENFVDGVARVSNSNTTFSVINKKGEEIFKGEGETSYSPINDNVMPFKRKTGDAYFYGLIDIKSKEKIIKDAKYRYMRTPYDGYLSVANNDLEWGMINTKGEVIGDLRLKFGYAPIYSKSGVILAKDDKKIKMFDGKGELIKTFDEYSVIYPVGKNRFFAYRANGKFDILDKDGKEVSKESYLFAGGFEMDWNREFNILEQTGITKNFFSIESKYFEFEKSFVSIFKSISTSDLSGVTPALSIEQVIAKFPYKAYTYGGSSANKSDDFRLEFDIAGSKNPNPNEAKVDPAAASQSSTIANGPVDKYPFLNDYSSSYRTYLNLGGRTNITYTFNFDQVLKTGTYSEQTGTTSYDLNRVAKIITFTINYELGDIDTKLFYDNMVKKITDAGWMKEESTGYYINPRNRYKLSLDNSSLTIYFGTNESSTSAVNNVPETDYVESED